MWTGSCTHANTADIFLEKMKELDRLFSTAKYLFLEVSELFNHFTLMS